jgi:hypothetical protein
MGFETGNVHLGSPHMRDAIQHDLESRPENWLIEAAKLMRKNATIDWKKWRKSCD